MISREEVLKDLEQLYKYTDDNSEGYMLNCADVNGIKYKLNNIKAYLTQSPTSEEVCKALSEYFKEEVKYMNKLFYYGEGLRHCEICDNYLDDINGKSLFNINFALPPHLITMIGKFYEGSESV